MISLETEKNGILAGSKFDLGLVSCTLSVYLVISNLTWKSVTLILFYSSAHNRLLDASLKAEFNLC